MVEKQLLPNLPQKCVLIIDNASYHSRQEVKAPAQATKKAEILEFMMKKNIPIPNPVPTRPVLFERIKLFQVEKEYFVDNLIRRHGHEVLRLPSYHCVLDAIELAWSKLKRTVRSENVFTEQPDKVMHLIKKVCDEISSDERSKFVRHVEKEEEKFRTRDHILDTEIEPLIIALADDDDSDVEYIEEDCGVPNEY